jgi:hypothetical protein
MAHITIGALLMTFLERVSYFSTILAGLQSYLSITSWFLATMIVLWQVVIGTSHNSGHHLYYLRMII